MQQPIPIWIGGNSKLTIRRVAENAQGWLPLTSTVDISATTRTPFLGSIDDLGARIADLAQLAGDRARSIEIVTAYTDTTIANAPNDVQRHRDTFAALEAIGVTAIVVAVSPNTYPASRAFIDQFADDP